MNSALNLFDLDNLFRLGCVLYVMLTTERPFRSDTTISLLTALALDTPKSSCAIVPGVPVPLSDFVMRLLAKQSAVRPASTLDVLDELRHLARGTAAPAPKAVTPTLRPAKR